MIKNMLSYLKLAESYLSQIHYLILIRFIRSHFLIIIKIFGFSILKPKYTNNVPVGERLSSALKLGPTFIK